LFVLQPEEHLAKQIVQQYQPVFFRHKIKPPQQLAQIVPAGTQQHIGRITQNAFQGTTFGNPLNWL